MMTGNLWVIEHDRIVVLPSQRNQGSTQWDRANLGQDFLWQTAAIVVAQGDEGAMLVTDAEDLTTSERLAKGFTPSNHFALIRDAVERLASRRVGMDKDQFVAFT